MLPTKNRRILYLANNDDLRLLDTALAREYTLQQIMTATDDIRGIMEDELKEIELTSTKSYYHYPGMHMNTLASIRHGPLFVLTDVPEMGPVTYLSLTEMTEILFATNYEPRPLSNISPTISPTDLSWYILNRTTVTRL